MSSWLVGYWGIVTVYAVVTPRTPLSNHRRHVQDKDASPIFSCKIDRDRSKPIIVAYRIVGLAYQYRQIVAVPGKASFIWMMDPDFAFSFLPIYDFGSGSTVPVFPRVCLLTWLQFIAADR